MKWLADRVAGFAQAALLVAALLGLLQCAGCASDNGVQMTEAEAAACKAEGCAVFTENELRAVVNQALRAGYMKGWADATRQTAKDL